LRDHSQVRLAAAEVRGKLGCSVGGSSITSLPGAPILARRRGFCAIRSQRAFAGDGGSPGILGAAAPVIMQLGFSVREGGDRPYKTQVASDFSGSARSVGRRICFGGTFLLSLAHIGGLTWRGDQRSLGGRRGGRPSSSRRQLSRRGPRRPTAT
jgi:hypothetical protein